MATPADIRRERLKNDCEEMYRIKGSIIEWQALSGVAPYIETYSLTVRVRSIIDPSPKMRDVHRFQITLGPKYPDEPPQIFSLDSPFPFNPNLFRNGTWCYGRWFPTKLLGDHVLRLVRTLQYDPHLINTKSPANPDASAWYNIHLVGGLFPTDRQRLPATDRPKLKIRPR